MAERSMGIGRRWRLLAFCGLPAKAALGQTVLCSRQQPAKKVTQIRLRNLQQLKSQLAITFNRWVLLQPAHFERIHQLLLRNNKIHYRAGKDLMSRISHFKKNAYERRRKSRFAPIS